MNTMKTKYDKLESPSSLEAVRQIVQRQKVKENESLGLSPNIADQILQLKNIVAELSPVCPIHD